MEELWGRSCVKVLVSVSGGVLVLVSDVVLDATDGWVDWGVTSSVGITSSINKNQKCLLILTSLAS